MAAAMAAAAARIIQQATISIWFESRAAQAAGHGRAGRGAVRSREEGSRKTPDFVDCVALLARSLARPLARSLAPLDDTFMDLRRSERRDPPLTPCATTATVRMAIIGVRPFVRSLQGPLTDLPLPRRSHNCDRRHPIPQCV